MSYNGYRNYETWVVKLWIDNDQGEQEFWLDQAVGAKRRANNPAHSLAEQLKDYHQEDAPTVSGVYADLLNAALSSVDWYEVAESLLADAEDEDEDEDEDEEFVPEFEAGDWVEYNTNEASGRWAAAQILTVDTTDREFPYQVSYEFLPGSGPVVAWAASHEVRREQNGDE